jgi:hypothetical protein
MYLNIFMIVALSTSLQWLLDIIFDLDHPFRGEWNVSRRQLDALRHKLANAKSSIRRRSASACVTQCTG